MRNIQAPHQIRTTKLNQWHSNLAWDSWEFSVSVLTISKPLQHFKLMQVWTAINYFFLKAHHYIKQRTFTIYIHRYINITNFNYSLWYYILFQYWSIVVLIIWFCYENVDESKQWAIKPVHFSVKAVLFYFQFVLLRWSYNSLLIMSDLLTKNAKVSFLFHSLKVIHKLFLIQTAKESEGFVDCSSNHLVKDSSLYDETVCEVISFSFLLFYFFLNIFMYSCQLLYWNLC